jgi:hypothetical protein
MYCNVVISDDLVELVREAENNYYHRRQTHCTTNNTLDS